MPGNSATQLMQTPACRRPAAPPAPATILACGSNSAPPSKSHLQVPTLPSLPPRSNGSPPPSRSRYSSIFLLVASPAQHILPSPATVAPRHRQPRCNSFAVHILEPTWYIHSGGPGTVACAHPETGPWPACNPATAFFFSTRPPGQLCYRRLFHDTCP